MTTTTTDSFTDPQSIYKEAESGMTPRRLIAFAKLQGWPTRKIYGRTWISAGHYREWLAANQSPVDNGIICSGCGQPITGKDYDSRIWQHEKSCPNYSIDTEADDDGLYAEPVSCTCDLEYHPACYEALAKANGNGKLCGSTEA